MLQWPRSDPSEHGVERGRESELESWGRGHFFEPARLFSALPRGPPWCCRLGVIPPPALVRRGPWLCSDPTRTCGSDQLKTRHRQAGTEDGVLRSDVLDLGCVRDAELDDREAVIELAGYPLIGIVGE